MKWILAFSLLFLANCANQPTAPVSENSSNQTNSVNNLSNNQNAHSEYMKINSEKVEKLTVQNEKFKTVPEEFKKIDFENFTYPTDYPKKSVKLKDGAYKFEQKPSGGGWFNFDDVFFVDLTNDEKKEAVVFLWRVDCGVSCDGGAALVYVYQSIAEKPKLIWNFNFGSMAYECGLKTLTIKERKISFEVFGRCTDKMKIISTDGETFGKFTAVDFTEFVYRFNGQKFVQEKKEIHAVGRLSYWNHGPEISITD